MKDSVQFGHCSTIGDSLTLNESQISTAVTLICRLYGDTKCTSLNELGCQKAEKGVLVRKIPSTQDAFMLHLRGTMYQLFIWENDVIPVHHTPRAPATGYGYIKSQDDTLTPRMMAQQEAVPVLLHLVVCECHEGLCSVIVHVST
jgi:hypothetical protein